MATKIKVSNSIIKGLKEAIEYEKGNKGVDVNIKQISISPLPHLKGKDVKSIRNKLNLSQRSFAMLMGVSIKTVEAWESGRNEPNGTAQRMLSLFQMDNTLPEKYDLLHFGKVS